MSRHEGKMIVLALSIISLLIFLAQNLSGQSTPQLGGGSSLNPAMAADITQVAAGPTPSSIVALPPAQVGSLGATLPFTEYEAEAAQTNGQLIGPDRTFTTIAAEASGRKAVRLAGVGHYVEFTLAQPANAVTVRYAIPDSTDGRGLDATLAVETGGSRIGVLKTSSRYGWFYGTNPFTNRPADGKPHHFFDEARLMFGQTLPAGATVRLAVASDSAAPWYVVDLADFELVPAPIAAPANSISVLAYGADPTGVRDSLAAFRSAVSAGKTQARTVWIPAGEFKVNGHVDVDRVTLAGAGPWYSVLRGTGVGIYGRYPPTPSTAVTLRDFAIIGEVMERNDQAPLSGVGGAMGGGSLLLNLWIQHQKTGVWFDGPMDGVTIRGLRILDVTADGINFRRAVSHAVVEDTFIRNSGDDGLAMWSHHEANHDNAFRHNTIVSPILANGIGIYGGSNAEISDNVIADTLTQGGGIHVGNRFAAVPLSGNLTITDNLIVRAGSFDDTWRMGIGAIWFYALEAPIAANITLQDNAVLDSGQQAVLIKGSNVSGLMIDRMQVNGATTYLLQVQAPGSTTFKDVVATGLSASVTGCRADFKMIDQGGNSSWMTPADTQACGH